MEKREKWEAMVMLAWRPGTREWWQEARSEGLLDNWDGWGEEVSGLLGAKIM